MIALAISSISIAVVSTASASAIGSMTDPAFSAKQNSLEGASMGDGLYWIDRNGRSASDAFQAYADMTTAGGGWTLGLVNKRNGKAASASGWD